MKNRGWIFISHSHQDIDQVRQIRNHFEALGFEPLMFYLKCLSDESEIEALIKREIDEREWFIYADSPNARKSKWVKAERDHIEKTEGKKIFVIDLQTELKDQLKLIEHIARQMKVFISYTPQDSELYLKLRHRLTERDMLVISNNEIEVGENWLDSAYNKVSSACRDGFVLLLITENACRSNSIVYEIKHAIAEKGKIIPVYVGKGSLHPELIQLIGNVQGVSISEAPTDEEINKVVDHILHRVEFYSGDFTNSYGYRSAEIIHLPPISCIDELTFWDCANLKCVYVPNSVVYITPDAFDEHKDVLIKCYSDSYCEGYCKKHSLRYEIIPEPKT